MVALQRRGYEWHFWKILTVIGLLGSLWVYSSSFHYYFLSPASGESVNPPQGEIISSAQGEALAGSENSFTAPIAIDNHPAEGYYAGCMGETRVITQYHENSLVSTYKVIEGCSVSSAF